MSALHFEIERTEKVLVKINVEAYCKFWAKERAAFDGSDEEFVRESVEEIAADFVIDRLPYAGEGAEIEADPCDGDIETWFLGVVA